MRKYKPCRDKGYQLFARDYQETLSTKIGIRKYKVCVKNTDC